MRSETLDLWRSAVFFSGADCSGGENDVRLVKANGWTCRYAADLGGNQTMRKEPLKEAGVAKGEFLSRALPIQVNIGRVAVAFCRENGSSLMAVIQQLVCACG